MKKGLIFLLAAVMILLPSCGKKVKKESVSPRLPDCTASVKYGGTDYSARVHYTETGIMSVEMLSPLKGLKLTVSDSLCTVSYGGMKLDYTAQEAKNFCPFIDLYGIVKTVCYTVPESAKENAEEYVLKYRTPDLSCTAVAGKKDGQLREIQTEDLKFFFR